MTGSDGSDGGFASALSRVSVMGIQTPLVRRGNRSSALDLAIFSAQKAQLTGTKHKFQQMVK